MFQNFRCLPYPTPQSCGLHLKIAWQVNKNCFVNLPEVIPWDEKYDFFKKRFGPFGKKLSWQKRVLEADLIQLVGHSILVAQIAWHVSCRRGFFFCNCHFICTILKCGDREWNFAEIQLSLSSNANGKVEGEVAINLRGQMTPDLSIFEDLRKGEAG